MLREKTADEERTARRQGRWTREQSIFWYRLAFLLFSLIFRFWSRCFRVIAPEKVPSRGGAFLIANHTSAIDPFIFGVAVKNRMLRGPGKIELFKSPIISFLMRKLGIFPLRRDIADTGAVRAMVELFRNDRVVIIFPEGGRSKTGEIMPFDPDFARLAIRLKAPLIPAGIAGAAQFLPIGGRIPRRNVPVVVAFGDEFDLSPFYDRKPTPEVLAAAENLMRSRVEEMVEVARRERDKLAVRCE